MVKNKGSVKYQGTFLVMMLSSLALCSAMLWRRIAINPSIYLDFHWTPYLLVDIACVVVLVGIIVLISRAKVGGRVVMWYIIHTMAMLTWAVGTTLAMASANAQGYALWSSLGSLGLVMMPPLFFIFTLAYVRNDKLLYRWTTLGGLLFTGTLVTYFITVSPFVFKVAEPLVKPWGYTPPAAKGGDLLFVVYIELIYLFALYVLFRHWRESRDSIVRKQTMFFLMASYLPFIGATVTDIIMPMLGVHMMPLVLVWITILGIGVSYAIFKYGLFHYDYIALSETIVASVSEGLMVADRNGRVVQLNDAGRKMLEISEDTRVEGLIWNDLFDVYIAGRHISKEESDKVIKNGLQKRLDYLLKDDVYYQTHTGKKFPVTVTITPVEDAAGGGSVLVFRDITEDKQKTQTIEHEVKERTSELHKTQTQLVASVNSLKQGYVMTDHKGHVLNMNYAASMLFCPNEHGSKDHLNTCNMQDIITSLRGKLDIEAKIHAVLSHKKAQEYDNIPFSTRFLRLYISPIIMEEKPIGTTILVEDVTEARIMERSKDEFFSIASHELRTPLTAIRGNAKMIDEFYSEDLKDESLRSMIHDIYESSVRLIEIVNDFLDVSRLEQGKINYQPVPFAIDRVVESVIYEMNSVAKQRGITLTMHKTRLGELPLVFADKDRIKQIVYNLIGNALKFTNEGSVTVDFSHTKQLLKVQVTDTGRGISEEGKQLLFRKFQQAGESLFTRDTTKGTGLGLYISKLLVEAMGGTIALERSEIGTGTTFSFTVPLVSENKLKQLSKHTLDQIEQQVEQRENVKSTFASSANARKQDALD